MVEKLTPPTGPTGRRASFVLRFASGAKAKLEHGRLGSYSDRQRALGRPLSPYLSIYKQPITAVSSISNRISAVALGTGMATASMLVVVSPNGDLRPLIMRAQDSTPYFAPVAKFLLAWPLTYHWLAGVRHTVMTPPLNTTEAVPCCELMRVMMK